MNYRQANAYYQRQVVELVPMLEMAKQAEQRAEAEYQAASEPEHRARMVRLGFAMATSAKDCLVAYATAAINAEASKSRFGTQGRAHEAQARFLPSLEDARKRVEQWQRRAVEQRVTLPEERSGVDIALGADAELRDVYRAYNEGVIDAVGVQERVESVAVRFQIPRQELADWHVSQGFAPPGAPARQLN